MDQVRFDALARSVGTAVSRRVFGGVLSAAGLGALAGAAARDEVSAKKKGKKRKHKNRTRKATPNEFGCLEVNDPCASDEQCCSGVCENKKCRAHDTGTCKQDGQLVPCNNRTTCGCFQTTAGSDVCAELFVPGGSACAACQRDADCEALGFPPGSACGVSPVACESGAMACFVPCGKASQEP